MRISRTVLGVLISAASLAGQPNDSTTQEPGARLKLLPSEPLTEPHFPKPAASGAGKERERQIRSTAIDGKAAGDPIYFVDGRELDFEQNEWRTYRRPVVDGFSKDGRGIALQGYDVVSYLEKEARKGIDAFSVEYGGATWIFASAEHRDLFSKSPEAYVPEYGGFCAYSLGRNYPATADPRVFAIEGRKLYLFFDKTARAVWEQDKHQFVMKADWHWPRLHR